MNFDITKIANAILYILEKDVSHLNDKKLSILLFLIDYTHQKVKGDKIFGEEYIKQKRQPEPKIMGELFEIIANDVDLEEDDERVVLITELLDYLDIEIITKAKFIELKFIKMEEDFDITLFNRKEMKTIDEIIEKYKDDTPRKLANACFKIQKVRETAVGELII